MKRAARRRVCAVAVAGVALVLSACAGPGPQGLAVEPEHVDDAVRSPALGTAPPVAASATTAPSANSPRNAPDPATGRTIRERASATMRTAMPSTADTVATTAPPTTNPPLVERSGADVGPKHVVGDPVGIRIPSLDVDSPIVPTGVSPDGTVAVPPSADVAGWFEPGPRPGERGPSVVMAHVDSARTGPGVFYRLREILPGALVTIETSDGPIEFRVDRIEQHAKDDFPTDDVYGPVPGSELRLVTCGGEFDRSVRSYDDNIVVYLTRAAP